MVAHLIRHPTQQMIINFCISFAARAYFGQKRKYTGLDFVSHPYEVAWFVSVVTDDWEMICAALLHDVLEDTCYTEEDIALYVNESVARLVKGLTNVTTLSDGKRKTRKKIERDRLAAEDARVQTIKMADIVSNGIDLLQYCQDDFLHVWMSEARQLFKALTKANPVLRAKAAEVLYELYQP